jgi:hypothetical protein
LIVVVFDLSIFQISDSTMSDITNDTLATNSRLRDTLEQIDADFAINGGGDAGASLDIEDIDESDMVLEFAITPDPLPSVSDAAGKRKAESNRKGRADTIDENEEADDAPASKLSDECTPPLAGFRLEAVKKAIDEVKKVLKKHGSKAEKDARKKAISSLFNWSFWYTIQHPVVRDANSISGFVGPTRIFFWLPRIYGYKLACPYCSSEQTVSNGWPRDPIARRVVDLSDCYWIVGRRQWCKSCDREFMNTDQRVVDRLPDHFRLLFPAFLTWRSGVDLRLLEMLRTSVSHSMGISQFLGMLHENHSRQYDKLKLMYLSRNKLKRASNNFHGKLDEFPQFDDPKGYAGFVPTAGYLTEVYIMYILLHEKELAAQLAKATGEILSVDHSHKVCCSLT